MKIACRRKVVRGFVLAAGLIAGNLLAQQDSAGHPEMTQLVDKLAASLTAMENEKDPVALQTKMAEHRKLIEQLRALVASEPKIEPAKAGPPENPEKHDPKKPAESRTGDR